MLNITIVPLVLCYLVVCIILMCLCRFYWTRRKLYVASYNYDGPLAFPIIGNALSFIGHNDKILMKLYHIVESYQPIPMRFWLGPVLALVFSSPDHAEKILSSSKFAHKHDLYKFLQIFIGNGLISGSGSNHKLHRRIIQPMVNLNFVLVHLDIVHKHINECISSLNDFVGKGTFNILEHVHKCFRDIIKELIFGVEAKSQLDGENKFDQVIVEFYDIIFSRLMKVHLQIDFIFNMTSLKKKQTKYRDLIRNLVRQFIKEAQEKKKLKLNGSSFNPIINQMNEFLEENPGFFDEDTFIDHILTLYLAAEDTITVISAFLLLCLGMNLEYQVMVSKLL
ncbi:hypothetical protein GWI33_007608 [Rhynchophorus ferrugineus]|uniref:Cytochrome P450 n=1 Tax=Rhynchophorus ferrugineus TaxID=354439 RepID=A0A834IHN4_RHYFE|nr:hypothetical protein GWI33_007608 [Rhynchophorus ferrugineus]